MSKLDEYQRALSALSDWEPYLLERSGLPGPRGNIELAMAFSKVGTLEDFQRLLDENPAQLPPVNDPRQFLAFCGAGGLGRCLAQGDLSQTARLRELANDDAQAHSRGGNVWRCSAGECEKDALLDEMRLWQPLPSWRNAPRRPRSASALLKQAGMPGGCLTFWSGRWRGITQAQSASRRGISRCARAGLLLERGAALYPEGGKGPLSSG